MYDVLIGETEQRKSKPKVCNNEMIDYGIWKKTLAQKKGKRQETME